MQTAGPQPLKSFSVKGPVRTVAFFPDGVRVAMGGFPDGSVHIWNLDTGKEDGDPLKGHAKPVTSLAVSKGGNGVVTGSNDGKVLLWTCGQNRKPVSKQLFSYPHKGGTEGISFNTKSDIPTMIACASSKSSIEIWSLKPRARPARRSLIAIPGTIQSFRFSGAARALIAVACDDKTVRIFGVRTGQQLESAELPRSMLSLEWSINPPRIASTADKTIYFAEEGSNGWTWHEMNGHTQTIKSIGFHPKGRLMVSGGNDKCLRVWDAGSRVQIGGSAHLAAAITHVVFSPDGKRILAICETNVLIWNTENFSLQLASPSSSTKPKVPALDPLTTFFARYPRFDYDATQAPTTEFDRMCSYFKWEKEDAARDGPNKAFRKALTEQFNMIYGTDIESLASWQLLCAKMGISPIPDSTSKCRNIFRTKHVNLVDLVDDSLDRVLTFNTLKKLRIYSKRTGKIFPKEEAYAGGLLKYLLRQINKPSIGYGLNLAGSRHGRRFIRSG